VEDAIKAIEKDIPRIINEGVKPFVQDPTPANKEKLQDLIQNVRPPLDDIAEVLGEDPTADLGRKEKQEAAKLARAAKKGDPKAAEAALKALQNLNANFGKQARDRAAQLPPKLKDHIEKQIKQLDDKVKALEPAVQAFSKKPGDLAAKDLVAELAEELSQPIDLVIEDLKMAPLAERDEAQQSAKQIIAAIRHKNIKKVDPSHLIKISKHLAGLLTDMVGKTGDDIRGQSDLSDRAKAALELDKLLSSLEKDAGGRSQSGSAQSVDQLLSSLNIATAGHSSGPQTQLSQQITSVVKDIRTKTTSNGSIEGTPLHQISQALAADLQKFADADSGNSRSELILLGKAISINIIRLADELQRLASACTDPKIQSKLLLNSQVLRNYATQLKIMASVRAATPKNSNDSSSDNLVVLTQNLAAVIGDATNAVSIMKQTKKGTV